MRRRSAHALRMSPIRACYWLFAAVVLAACQAVAPQPAAGTTATSVDLPPGDAGTLYRLQPQASQVIIYVYRAGAAARFGHNHSVTVPRLAEIGSTAGGDKGVPYV